LRAGVQDEEWPGPLVHEIRRAAHHVAGGLLVAQNIVTQCATALPAGVERP
jgi:hypothetical protein